MIKEHEAYTNAPVRHSGTTGHTIGRNHDMQNYKIQETTGLHRTCSNEDERPHTHYPTVKTEPPMQ